MSSLLIYQCLLELREMNSKIFYAQFQMESLVETIMQHEVRHDIRLLN